MNMREKIAVALFKTDYPKDDWARLDAGRGSYNQDRYRAKSDAVLDALMEPTEEMVESVTDRHYMGDWECPTCGGGKAAFVAMIRAAKEGK